MQTLNLNIDERVERARGYFTAGYNCAQAVVMAFDDVMGQSPEALARLAAPFEILCEKKLRQKNSNHFFINYLFPYSLDIIESSVSLSKR